MLTYQNLIPIGGLEVAEKKTSLPKARTRILGDRELAKAESRLQEKTRHGKRRVRVLYDSNAAAFEKTMQEKEYVRTVLVEWNKGRS